jgi:hypothetical protein
MLTTTNTRGRGPEGADDLPDQAERSSNRRSTDRIHTLFRTAHISWRGDSGLCRVRNMSDSGMMIATGLDIEVAAPVRVQLSDRTSLSARVVWRNEDGVGIRFDERMDCAAVLQALAAEQLSSGRRAPRLRVNMIGIAASEMGLHVVRVFDISQHGLKLAHDGSLRPDQQIKVMLDNGVERRAVVRWSDDRMAGVRLFDAIPLDHLRSANRL